MNFIGLDLATKRTGCCIMDSEENLIHYECIVAPRYPNFLDRIFFIGDCVEEIIKKYKPEIMALEEPPIIKNTSASMLLIMNGYFMKISKDYNLERMMFQPTEWRKPLGILKGLPQHANKELQKKSTVDYVNKRFGTNFEYIKDSVKSTDDISDAIGVATCAIKTRSEKIG